LGVVNEIVAKEDIMSWHWRGDAKGKCTKREKKIKTVLKFRRRLSWGRTFIKGSPSQTTYGQKKQIDSW